MYLRKFSGRHLHIEAAKTWTAKLLLWTSLNIGPFSGNLFVCFYFVCPMIFATYLLRIKTANEIKQRSGRKKINVKWHRLNILCFLTSWRRILAQSDCNIRIRLIANLFDFTRSSGQVMSSRPSKDSDPECFHILTFVRFCHCLCRNYPYWIKWEIQSECFKASSTWECVAVLHQA